MLGPISTDDAEQYIIDIANNENHEYDISHVYRCLDLLFRRGCTYDNMYEVYKNLHFGFALFIKVWVKTYGLDGDLIDHNHAMWLSDAVGQNDSMAITMMADCLRDGKLMEKSAFFETSSDNQHKSIELYKLASSMGNYKASEHLADLYNGGYADEWDWFTDLQKYSHYDQISKNQYNSQVQCV